jgi:hypothetical protein
MVHVELIVVLKVHRCISTHVSALSRAIPHIVLSRSVQTLVADVLNRNFHLLSKLLAVNSLIKQLLFLHLHSLPLFLYHLVEFPGFFNCFF